MSLNLRPATSGDDLVLADLWRRAVEATHDFLSPEDVDFYAGHIRDVYLPALKVTVAEFDGAVVGFVGTQEHRLEMLFVEPDAHGRGVGTALVEHVAAQHPVLELDVNEQNPAARGFYASLGFEVVGRSPLDGEGRPFPLLHLRRSVNPSA
ncbi:acetyltransferase [Aeromicrobium phragmitis]|uniref:acetyltransferase n=1 Tax=Aeromicrobium phragmitis TaxID=2478914 RepID=UPI001FB7FC48|nr:acetyltransferase [Aeromicrobium phragmitis]